MKILNVLSLVGSSLTIILGVANLVYGWVELNYAPSGCKFYYCNSNWRSLITFAPDNFMDTFQPMILGSIGVLYSLPLGMRPRSPEILSPPSSSWAGGVFHMVMALFANLGYMFWLGMAIAGYNILLGLVIVIVNLLQTRDRVASRPKDADEIPSERREDATTDAIDSDPQAQRV